jgi:hypothetical protein
MVRAPVVVDVEAVVLLTDKGPETVRPVKVPREVTPGWAAFTETTLPARVSPVQLLINGSNAALAAVVVMYPLPVTKACDATGSTPMYIFPAYTLPPTPNPPAPAMTTVPVDVEVDATPPFAVSAPAKVTALSKVAAALLRVR